MAINVQIVQPDVPEYRVPLFEKLSDQENINLSVCASQVGLTAKSLLIGEDSHSGDFNITWHRCSTMLFGRLFWQRSLSLRPELKKGDVLVICGNPRYVSNYPLMFKAKLRGVSICWWGHGWTAGSRGLGAWVRKQIMKTADVLLLYTEIEREQYVNMGFSPSNCFATNNCIDQLPIVKASEAWPDASVERFRRESGLEGRDVFLFCGRVTAKSRLAICVQALRHLVEAGRDPVLVIIGEGSEVEALKREARLRGVTANLYWIGALYDQATLAPWFRSSISLVYPGAIGLSLIHSFGYALPVITHGDPIDHMPEFAALKEGFNGLLFEKGCPEDLARKMLLLAENKGLRRRLSENSFRTVQDEFSFDGMVERFRNALEKASEIAIAAS